MKMPPSSIPENRSCSLLTNEENNQLFKLLGNRCQSLCTTVVQLYSTEAPSHSQWFKRDVGILCFIKDNIKKNYFFRLYCLRRNRMTWEHEMYNNMEYTESTIFLHIFEGEDTIIAFNFAKDNEARDFKCIVEEKLMARRRREEKRSRQSKVPRAPNNYIAPDLNSHKKQIDAVSKQAKRKRNITKADIGIPLDFKHISHVGWNPDSGFDIDSEDDQLKCFFEKAGISEKQLQDKDTKEFIYEFINKHGGREAVEETNRNSGRRAPAAPPAAAGAPVPPVPPRGPPRPPHVRTAPPPPPPPSLGNHVRAPVVNNVESAPPPPPPMLDMGTKSIPPPPPPPPMAMMPDNINNNNNNNNDDADIGSTAVSAPPLPSLNSALMESIKSGTTLKHVEERKSTPVDDSRGDLLSEIRKGISLKPVNERDIKPLNNVPEPGKGNLAEALARALAERSKAIHSEDDDDEEDSNDEDWD